MTIRALWCIASVTLLAATADAQLIGIKTAPVAQGDQLGFLPSANLGMANVSIALPDTLRDPFVNPATAGRLQRSHFFGSPSFYSVSNRGGGGRTLPVGSLLRSGPYFSAIALAIQEISPAANDNAVFDGGFRLLAPPGQLPSDFPRPRSHTNRYVYAMFGRTLEKAQLSLGASAFWSGLNVVDGVDVLYSGSQGIRQSGQAVDYRLGLLKEWSGAQSLEAMVLYNRFAMTHDVGFIDLYWDPATRQPLPRTRLEHNSDRTNTLGLHLEYERPLADSGWRVGYMFTANRMSQPQRPDYAMLNLPKDPGKSSAYNLGVGVSKTLAPGILALDVIYEPIWSYTWADAEEPVETQPGVFIPLGGKTLENRFRFHNAVVRTGISRDFDLDAESVVRLQLGLQMRSINYSLAQRDFIQSVDRAQRESWTEWTRSWGLGLRAPGFEVNYRWRSIIGTGRPEAFFGGFAGGVADASSSSVIPFPTGQMTLGSVRVTTHQFSVSVPLR
jgi:hypothetical protein